MKLTIKSEKYVVEEYLKSLATTASRFPKDQIENEDTSLLKRGEKLLHETDEFIIGDSGSMIVLRLKNLTSKEVDYSDLLRTGTIRGEYFPLEYISAGGNRSCVIDDDGSIAASVTFSNKYPMMGLVISLAERLYLTTNQ